MIKAEEIKRLIKVKVAPILDKHLRQYGYKFATTTLTFKNKKDDLQRVITLSKSISSFSYDKEAEIVRLRFNLNFRIKVPKFEKWVKEKKLDRSYSYQNIPHNQVVGYLDLDPKEVRLGNTYIPTASQSFKRAVVGSLSSGNQVGEYSMQELLDFRLEELLGIIDSVSDKFYNENSTIQHLSVDIYFLLYQERMEEAKEACLTYLNRVSKAVDEKKVKSERMGSLKRTTEDLLNNYYLITGVKIENPLDVTLNLIESRDAVYEFTKDYKFHEIYRFDISKFKVVDILINEVGEILYVLNDIEVFKLNEKGELLVNFKLETEPNYSPGAAFGNHSPEAALASNIRVLKNKFFVNNYVVLETNEVLRLSLSSFNRIYKKHLNSGITYGLTYNEKLDNFLQLVQRKEATALAFYNKNGEFLKSIEVTGRPKTILTNQKLFITVVDIKKNVLWNFEGEKIAELPCGNGNYRRTTFSKDEKYLISHFYSTKSELYNLETYKKSVLWGHPTFKKDYKEVLYQRINHNFGLNIASFSPDGTYIVGGADHGKYVAWRMPKAKRTELIPKDDLLNQMVTTDSFIVWGKGGQSITTQPRVVNLNGEDFLFNRANNAKYIEFTKDSEYFVIGIGDKATLWTKDFDNIKHFDNVKSMRIRGDFLFVEKEDELIVLSLQD